MIAYTTEMIGKADVLANDMLMHMISKEDHIPTTYLASVIALTRIHNLLGKIAPEVLPPNLCKMLVLIAHFLDTKDEYKH